MRATLKKSDHEEYVLRRAKELAESGRFSGWLGIEFELRYGEGFELARVWLDHPEVRAMAEWYSCFHCKSILRLSGAQEMRCPICAPVREELDIICHQAQARRSLGVA